MKLIAPSILSANFARLTEDIRLVEKAGADLLHLDVMDGHFVPNITFGPKMVADINSVTDMMLDVHLMISEPEKYIDVFAKAGADWVSVHYETAKDLRGLVKRIKDLGCKAGVVIKPNTSVDVLDSILSELDFVLIMSVEPGFGGQKFIESALDKAKSLKKKIEDKGLKVFIEMDGGIGLENIKTVSDSGVNVFVAGNSIFGSENPGRAIEEMKRIVK